MVVPPRWGARVGYRQYYDPQFPKGAEGLLRLRILPHLGRAHQPDRMPSCPLLSHMYLVISLI